MTSSKYQTTWVGGNDIKVLDDGPETYAAMLGAIIEAKQTILFANFCMQAGEMFNRFENALIARAKEGVKIYILADEYGSGRVNRGQVHRLRQAGIDWVWYQPFNPWKLLDFNHHLHKKLLIIDGQTAFTGGVGLADFWDHATGSYPLRWRDTHFQLEGPIIRDMITAFDKSWRRFSKVLLPQIDSSLPAVARERGTNIMAIDSHWRFNRMTQVGEHLTHLVRESKTDLILVSAYFGPTRQLRTALKAAVKRGVRVRLLLNGPHATHGVARDAGRHWYGQMLRAGLEIYEYQPTKIHCKITLVDGKLASVGSANLNFRTLKHDDEFNLLIDSKTIVDKLTKQFNTDLKHAIEVDRVAWSQRPLLKKLRQLIASWGRWVF